MLALKCLYYTYYGLYYTYQGCVSALKCLFEPVTSGFYYGSDGVRAPNPDPSPNTNPNLTLTRIQTLNPSNPNPHPNPHQVRSPLTMTRDPGMPEYRGEEDPQQATYNKP